jgi:hypothetical protein
MRISANLGGMIMARGDKMPRPARVEISIKGEDLVLDATCRFMGVKVMLDWKDFLRGLQELEKSLIVQRIEAGQRTLEGGL